MGLSYHLQLLIFCLPSLLFQISMLSTKDPELNQTSKETPLVHITEYSTALINISWVDSKRKVLHTDTSETGRFSSAGPTSVSGVLALPQSQLLEAPPIALLSRGKCTFDKKVENAEAAGAVGVIIYNNKDEEQLKTIAVSISAIPVVFTYQWKGKELLHLVEEGKTVFITMEEGSHCKQGAGNNSAFFTCVRTKNFPAVNPGFNSLGPFDEDNRIKEEDEIEQSLAVIVVSISFFILMMLSLGILLLYYLLRIRAFHAKDASERRAYRQALKALRNVELVVVEEVGKEKECMVCLEMMQSGEEVRCLPCGHRFHRKCIDTWLLSKRKCPLCNLNIVQHFGLLDYQDSDMESDQSDMVHMT